MNLFPDKLFNKFLAFLLVSTSFAKAEIALDKNKHFTLSGYAELYYAHDFNDPLTRTREITPSGSSPLVSYTRGDEPAINHALLDFKANYEPVRFALGVQDGSYVEANYASEDRWAHYFYEASMGVQLAKDLWLDGGIFPSHIGLEGAISKDDWNLTRSLMAENTPYYESGGKLTWEPNKQWLFSALVLRGWQSIGDPNNNLDGGTQVTFKPDDKWVFCSCTFFGEFGADQHKRYFHDFYTTWQFTDTLSFGAAFDTALEERSAADSSLNGWFSTAAFMRYQFAPKWALGGRVEHYHDPHGLTINTGTTDNFVANGGSVNLDYSPEEHVMLRWEIRNITADQPVFLQKNGLGGSDTTMTWSVIVTF